MHPLLTMMFVFCIAILITVVSLHIYIWITRWRIKATSDANPKTKTVFTEEELARHNRDTAVNAINIFYDSENDAVYQRRQVISREQQQIMKQLAC